MRTNSTYPPQSIQNKNPPRRKTMFSVVPEGCPGVRLGAGPERRDADPVLAHSTGGVRGREGGRVLRNCAPPLLLSITSRDQGKLPCCIHYRTRPRFVYLHAKAQQTAPQAEQSAFLPVFCCSRLLYLQQSALEKSIRGIKSQKAAALLCHDVSWWMQRQSALSRLHLVLVV